MVEAGSVIYDAGVAWVVIAVTNDAIIARDWSGRVAAFPLWTQAAPESLPVAA